MFYLAIITLPFLYLLPSAVAAMRSAHLTPAICVVNLFLGWALLGWVVALAMAVSLKPDPERSIVRLLKEYKS